MLWEMPMVFRWLKLNAAFSKTLPSQLQSLNKTICNDEILGTFKSNILKFIKSTPAGFFNCYNHERIRLMTSFRLGLSHLCEYELNHNFQNCINALSKSGMDIESTSHSFLHYPLFDDKRITLLNTLSKIDCKLIEANKSSLTRTLLFGNSLLHLEKSPLFLTNPLITFYPLKDSKNPCSKLFE